eukprot:2039706-Rhodomonas_salina.1
MIHPVQYGAAMHTRRSVLPTRVGTYSSNLVSSPSYSTMYLVPASATLVPRTPHRKRVGAKSS